MSLALRGDDGHWRLANREDGESGSDGAWLTACVRPRSAGFPLRTMREFDHSMYLSTLPNAPMPIGSELATLRGLLASDLASSGRASPRYVRALALGDGTYVECDWLAVVLDTLWWGLVVSLVAGLPGALGEWVAIGRAEERRYKGLCASCAYDLRGLPVEAVCPECGNARMQGEITPATP